MTGARSAGRGGRVGSVEAVVLAAGKGTRMRSDLPKVLHELDGRPLLDYVLDAVAAAGIRRPIVVVGHRADLVEAACAGREIRWVRQEPQLGTGHAVQVAEPLLAEEGSTLVLNGDVPLIRPRTLADLARRAAAAGVAAAVLTCTLPDAGAYGRIVKDGRGRLLRIVEARDATAAELAIGEINSGLFCFRNVDLRWALRRLTADNEQRELYLTDTVAHLVDAGREVLAVPAAVPEEVAGVNTVAELEAARRLLAAREAARERGEARR